MSARQIKNGILYVVATPIGNLEDITFRALRILQEVSLIAAEDTRHTLKLLNHYNIKNNLVSCYRENETIRSTKIIDELLHGNNVALVSDAGTPCISDPGSTLVAKAQQAGITVISVPGPSALTAALSISGMAYEHLLFVGFLPNSKAERRKRLSSLKHTESTIVFYESPRRVIACLRDISSIIGTRQVFVVRELTKIHEEYFKGDVTEVLSSLQDKTTIKGEFVIILQGCVSIEGPDGDDINDLIVWYRDKSGSSLSHSVKTISQDLGISKAKVYKAALLVWNLGKDDIN